MSCGETNQEAILLRGQAGSGRPFPRWRNTHGAGEGLMVHTDQGIEYQHSSWRQLIESVGGVQSMSRKGNCYDNAVMENFFGHLETLTT